MEPTPQRPTNRQVIVSGGTTTAMYPGTAIVSGSHYGVAVGGPVRVMFTSAIRELKGYIDPVAAMLFTSEIRNISQAYLGAWTYTTTKSSGT